MLRLTAISAISRSRPFLLVGVEWMDMERVAIALPHPGRDGWVILHCAHATSTARCDNHSINIVCALREHEG